MPTTPVNINFTKELSVLLKISVNITKEMQITIFNCPTSLTDPKLLQNIDFLVDIIEDFNKISITI